MNFFFDFHRPWLSLMELRNGKLEMAGKITENEKIDPNIIHSRNHR